LISTTTDSAAVVSYKTETVVNDNPISAVGTTADGIKDNNDDKARSTRMIEMIRSQFHPWYY
jgi:hypothetical protein